MKRSLRGILIVFTILVLCLPASMFVTVILYPFWLWVENTINIESAGHSGPSIWCYWVTYLICITLAMFSYFQLNVKKIISGLSILFACIVLVLILIPLPHGGSLGMGVVHELTNFIEDIPKRNVEANNRKAEYITKRDRLYQKLSGRFAGTLTFNKDSSRADWQTGTVLGTLAWLDTNTGIIWGSENQAIQENWGGKGLLSAINYCQNLTPKGFWSLPTNAEFALGIKSKMQNHIVNLSGKWIAQSYNSSMSGLNPMPSLVGFANQGNKVLSARCVGRTDKAPLHGYIRDDISNAEVMGMLNR